jgi:CO/xanthine dehydrogenase FAD-binding subunit
VTEVSFPVAESNGAYGFVEFARRHGDFAIAGAAVSLTLDGESISDASIVLCSVGPTPVRATAAEALLRGGGTDEETVAAAADAAVEGLSPPGDMHGDSPYRIRVARTQVQRALTRALERSRGGTS